MSRNCFYLLTLTLIQQNMSIKVFQILPKRELQSGTSQCGGSTVKVEFITPSKLNRLNLSHDAYQMTDSPNKLQTRSVASDLKNCTTVCWTMKEKQESTGHLLLLFFCQFLTKVFCYLQEQEAKYTATCKNKKQGAPLPTRTTDKVHCYLTKSFKIRSILTLVSFGKSMEMRRNQHMKNRVCFCFCAL